MVISVTINRAGPYEFTVDTGSQITIIEPSLAAELQLESAGVASVVAASRRAAKTYLVSPEVIEAGPYAVHRPLVAVESLAQFQALYPGIRGILGENFLMGFDLLIDRGKKIMCLDPTTEMRRNVRGEQVSVVRWGAGDDIRIAKRILVPVRLSGQGARTIHLRLDSGASTPILFVNPYEWEPWVRRAKALRAHVVGESEVLFKVMAPQKIRIGNSVVSDVTFAAPVASKQNVGFAGEDGLLPTSLFKRVFISYRGGFVVLDPR
jgi:hypothetical protein